MTDFKARNSQAHKELFDLSEELQSIAEEVRNSFNNASTKQNIRRSTIPTYKTVFLHFVNTAMREYSAIHILCAEGYASCASPILRALLENLVSMKYILLNDENELNEETANLKAKRFEEFKWINMNKMLRYWKKGKGIVRQDLQGDVLAREDEILDKVDEFKKTFKTKDLQNWAGLNIERMAEKVNMLEDYDLVYRMCCNLTHPSSLGFQISVKRDPQKTIFSQKPSTDQVISVLIIAIKYFHEMLILKDHLFSLKMYDNLIDFQRRARSVYESDKYQSRDKGS